MNVCGKILSKIIGERLNPIAEGTLPDEQHGFRQTCQAAQNTHDSGLSLVALFIDVMKAFDSTPCGLIYQVLTFLSVPKCIIDLVRSLHTKVECFVMGDPKESSTTEWGVRQGCVRPSFA